MSSHERDFDPNRVELVENRLATAERKLEKIIKNKENAEKKLIADSDIKTGHLAVFQQNLFFIFISALIPTLIVVLGTQKEGIEYGFILKLNLVIIAIWLLISVITYNTSTWASTSIILRMEAQIEGYNAILKAFEREKRADAFLERELSENEEMSSKDIKIFDFDTSQIGIFNSSNVLSDYEYARNSFTVYGDDVFHHQNDAQRVANKIRAFKINREKIIAKIKEEEAISRAKAYEEALDYEGAIRIWDSINLKGEEKREIARLELKMVSIKIEKAKACEKELDYEGAIEIWRALSFFVSRIGFYKNKEHHEKIKRLIDKSKSEQNRLKKQIKIDKANEREEALDYDAAIEIWETIGDTKEAARLRKLRAEMGAAKVSQKVVHGDYIDDRDTITKTEIKDSVVSKSNIGYGEDDKVAKLEKIANMKEKGLIDGEDYEKMKREIIG